MFKPLNPSRWTELSVFSGQVATGAKECLTIQAGAGHLLAQVREPENREMDSGYCKGFNIPNIL